MSKKKSKSPVKTTKEKNADPAIEQNPDSGESTTHEENESDFGGLPSRDLKKNLGCGG